MQKLMQHIVTAPVRNDLQGQIEIAKEIGAVAEMAFNKGVNFEVRSIFALARDRCRDV